LIVPASLLAVTQESEIETLAGKKEGCHDDVEFITVERSPAMPTRFPEVKSNNEVLKPIAGSSLDLGHPAEVATQWVDIPLGSVRVSLGYMSRFEDCYALARFIESKYRDRTA
jgi:molybdenum cofactor sulfurtransferase